MGSGKSYLWWLNGKNKGSQVAPQTVRNVGNEVLVAWDITQSNINEFCQGDLWNFSTGQTIFGLTSTTGTSVISYIGFVSSLDEITAISKVCTDADIKSQCVYTLDGKLVGKSVPEKQGLYIVNHKKIAK